MNYGFNFKSLKKFAAVVLSVIMVLGLIIPAYASDLEVLDGVWENEAEEFVIIEHVHSLECDHDHECEDILVEIGLEEEISSEFALASASGDAPAEDPSYADYNFSNGVLTIWGLGNCNFDPILGDSPWAAYSDQITTVIITDGITGIGRYAFYGCTNLQSVTMASSVVSIESGAFAGCERLTSIDIPSSIEFISPSAFEGCYNLSSINVDSANQVYSSNNGVLFNKSGSVLITCPSGKSGAFVVPDGVVSISYGAFADCSNITSVSLPESLQEIDEGAFLNCSSITSIVIPGSVYAIADIAFQGCTSLADVNISAGVTGIYASAFNGCTALRNIKIPASVRYIGDNAFYGCENFTVQYLGTQDQWDSIDVRLKYNTALENANLIIGSCDHVIETIKGYPATCITAGLTDGKTCLICGRKLEEQKVIPALGHDLTENQAVAATCTTAGRKEHFTCSVCGKMFLDSAAKNETNSSAIIIPASGHSLTSVAAKAATCTTAGNKAYWKCTKCGKLFLDKNGNTQTTAAAVVINPKGHSMTYTAHAYAKCEETGNEEYWTCNTCGKIYTDLDGKNETTLAAVTLPVRGHTVYMVGAREAAEDQPGNIVYYACSECDKIFSDREGKNETTLADVTIPATGHTLRAVAKLDATCQSAGHKAYWVCTTCARYYLDAAGRVETSESSLVIPVKSHTLSASAERPATCTASGRMAYWTCTSCGNIFLDANGRQGTTYSDTYIPAKGHTMAATPAKAATCESGGNMAYWTCTTCHGVYLDSTGSIATTVSQVQYPAKGHTMAATSAKAATCTTAGNVAYWTCTKCSKVYLDAEGKNETTRENVIIPAFGHRLTAVPAVEASCGVKGNKAYWTCENCGKVYLDENGVNETSLIAVQTSAKKHSVVITMSKAATCVAEGNKTYWTCSTCGKIFADSSAKTETTIEAMVIPAKGHNMSSVAAKTATCTTAGNKAYWKCSSCNKYFLDSEGKNETTLQAVTIPATGHSMNYTAALAASCETVGNTAYYTCRNCSRIFFDANGNSETTVASVLIPAKGHSMIATPAKAATCAQAGNKAYWTCRICNGVFADAEGKVRTGVLEYTIPAKGHTLVKTPAKDATESTSGNKAYWKCSVCSKLFLDAQGTNETTLEEVIIPATGHKHSFSLVNAKDATCTSDGNILFWRCTSCNKNYSDVSGLNELTSADIVIPAKGHNTKETAAVAPTCLTAGNRAYFTCETCGQISVDPEGRTVMAESEIAISATGHSMMATASKAATCTTAGNKAYWTCKNCGELFLDSEGKNKTTNSGTVIPAKGHSMTATAAKTATCEAAGNKAYWTCKTCGNMFLDANGTTKTSAAAVIIPAMGHIMEETTAREATCTDSGNLHFWKCPVCSKMFLDSEGKVTTTSAAVIVPAKGHNMTATAAVAATCTTGGNKAYWTCKTCGKMYLDANGNTLTTAYSVKVAAKGHNLTFVAGKDATETESGLREHYRCSDCGKLFEDAAGYKETTIESMKIPATGHTHTLKHTYAVPATCAAAGNISYWTCQSCGKIYIDQTATTEITPAETVVPAKGHVMKYTSEVQATCTSSGRSGYWTCYTCNKFYQDEAGTKEVKLSDITTPVAGHKLVYVDAKAAGCTTEGSIKHWKCLTCDKVFLDAAGSTLTSESQLSTKATGHKWDGGKVTKEATYTTKGIKTFTCSGCGLTRTEEIDTLLINQANGLGNSAAPDGNWYYVRNKRVDTSYTSITNNNNGWWYVENGMVRFDFNGFASNENGDWYCQGGKVTFSKTDLVYGTLNGVEAWWNVVGSQVKHAETVANNSSGWWYIDKEGKVDFSFNGFARNGNGTWYLEGGKVSFNKTDVILGKIDGVEAWWNVEGSQVKYYETVAHNSNGWWKIGKDGKVDFNFTGIASNANGTWYCQGGKVNFNYNGTVWYNGRSYRISGGQVVG